MWVTPKGKILKVKLGYNANSSSIATIVSVFLWGSAITVSLVNIISAVIFSKKPNLNSNYKGNDSLGK